ncbi:MAG: hypothetical protein HY738_14165, partial [Bacteroidia bacterium]|nr:hypothetical protein [Bacteroidia bacterium]
LLAEQVGYSNNYINQYTPYDRYGDFSYTINNYTVSFQKTSPSSYYTIGWSFGDGQNLYNNPTPSHTYTSSGRYEVLLTTTWLIGSTQYNHTRKKIIYIKDLINIPAGSYYFNDFETSDALNDFNITFSPYSRTEPKIIYHGLNNHALSLYGTRSVNEPAVTQEAKITLYSSSWTTLYMIFDYNSIGNCTDPLKIFINGIELAENYLFQGSTPDDRLHIVIDLTPWGYFMQQTDIAFRTTFNDVGHFYQFIDNLYFIEAQPVDLYVKDNGADSGIEPSPYIYPQYFIISPDVFVRNSSDVFIQQHQNFEYRGPSDPNYVFVVVNNQSNFPSVPVTVKLYWTRARYPETWTAHFSDISTNYDSDGDPLGGEIGTLTISSVPANSSNYCTFSWVPPDPLLYEITSGSYDTQQGYPQICLVARIEAQYDPVQGEALAFPIYQSVRNSNNMAMRNTHVVHVDKYPPVVSYTNIALCTDVTAEHSITFNAQYDISSQGSFLNFGNIIFDLGAIVFDRWYANGSQGSGIRINETNKTIKIISDNAKIEGIPLFKDDMRAVIIRFEPNKTINPLIELEYNYIFSQFKTYEPEVKLDYHYQVKIVPPYSLLAAITDSTYTTCAGACDASATVTAYGGTPPYTYQWGLETGSQTTATATGLYEGTYWVTVTDNQGSTALTSVNIIADPALFNYTGEITLTANITWSGENFRISDKIVVPADITLQIINSTIEFGSFGSIWVEKGGKLVVDRSALISLSGCTNMWGGIIVVGEEGQEQPETDPLLTGYPHGLVWLKNNSIIEDAVTGIFAGDEYKDTRHGSGGIVWVESGSKIINSYRDVYFKNYRYANRTHFDNCEFICNRYLKHRVYATEGTKDFVFSWGASNLSFNKVKFINTGTFAEDKRGTGFNSATPLNKGVFTACEFTGLTAGFNGVFYATTVSGCSFTGMPHGIGIKQFVTT